MNFVKILIIPTFAGLVSGALGAFFITRLFSEQVASSPFSAPLIARVSSSNIEERIEITAAKKSLVFFYPVGKKELLTPAEASALGLALTTDGLIVSPNYIKSPSSFIAVSSATDPFHIEFAKDKRGVIFSNPESGFTFYKIKSDINETPRLSPVEFCHFEDIYAGQTVFSFDAAIRGVVLHHILNIGQSTLPDIPLDMDALIGLLTVDNDLKAGTFIFEASGCLVGVALRDKTIFPAEFLDNMARGYLKEGSYAKIKLGARAINLSQFTTAPNDLPASGFLLRGDKDHPAVASGSPADRAGLKKGDVLISFDGQRLDQSFPFQLLLQRYLPGTAVDVEVLRGGKELKFKVVLGGE